MKTTSHGKKDPLYKATSLFPNKNGKRLTAFGWSKEDAERKIQEYLLDHQPVVQVQVKERPERLMLRVV